MDNTIKFTQIFYIFYYISLTTTLREIGELSPQSLEAMLQANSYMVKSIVKAISV